MVRRNVPLVEQIILEILTEIDGGRFARRDGLLPSESELSQQFRVSRATVREALSKLELAGVVIRRQGVGTFVNQFMGRQPILVQDWFDEAHGFTDSIRAAGRSASCTLLRVALEPAGELSRHLQIEADATVLRIVKIIKAEEVPLIHSCNAVPLAVLPEQLRPEAAERAAEYDSTYRFLEQCCDVRVHHQQSEVRAALAGDLASWLECQPSDACLRVEEVAYDADLRPLFYGLNHFRSDVVSFRQIRRPTLNIAQPLPAPA